MPFACFLTALACAAAAVVRLRFAILSGLTGNRVRLKSVAVFRRQVDCGGLEQGRSVAMAPCPE